MMMIFLFLFLLGLCFGSFLNVLIDRLPSGKSVVAGRSYCDHCKHKLAWYDLIPVLSFIILNRRCRYCGKIISWQYPVIEIITGLLYIFTYSSMIRIIEPGGFNFYSLFLYYLVIVSGLIVIFVADLKYHIIPDEILIVQIITALIYLTFFQRQSLIGNFIAGIVFFLSFLFLVITTKGKGMGLGDVKLAFVMGLILGFPNIIVAFYLSFLTGAVFSLILVLGRVKSLKGTIPFGPFLAGATVATMFYGQALWEIFRKVVGV